MRLGNAPDKQKVEGWLLRNLPRLGLDVCTDLCLKPGVPQSIRHKYIELAISAEITRTDLLASHYLSRFSDRTDVATKTLILQTWQKKAEEGNERAWSHLERMYESYLTDGNTKTLLFTWFLGTAENFSSPHNSKAWSLLKTLCGYFGTSAKADEVIQFYIRVAQRQGIPAERASFLNEELERLAEYGRAQQKAGILAYWTNLAEAGDVEKMYQCGKFYCENNDRTAGIRWLERASQTDHLPSIMHLGNLYYFGGDYDRAAVWYEKAGNRDPLAVVRLNRIRSSQDTSHRREEANRAREEYERDRAQQRQQRHSERARAEAEARARSEARGRARNGERNQQMAELKGHIGEFSSTTTLNTAYRRWALVNHPDKHGNDPVKTEIFKRVLALVEIFRAEYDKQAA
jgi:tetratricopeptide (TPR) repeat protein